MLYESNWLRLQSFKYGPLFLGLSNFTFIYSIAKEGRPNAWFALIAVSMISVIFFLLFFLMKDKFKFVIIGKPKLIVKDGEHSIEYGWLDVEQIKLIHFFKLYKLKLKDEDPLYFATYGFVSLLTGDTSEMGALIEKMKKELAI
jgi:hypothetical protein